MSEEIYTAANLVKRLLILESFPVVFALTISYFTLFYPDVKRRREVVKEICSENPTLDRKYIKQRVKEHDGALMKIPLIYPNKTLKDFVLIEVNNCL